jgi:hypothetical protein
MPATLKHIQINFERIERGNSDSMRVLLAQARELTAPVVDPSSESDLAHSVWTKLIELAEQQRIADQLPGTVGRFYAKRAGLIASRPKRGQRVSLKLTDAGQRAIEAYRLPSDAYKVEDGVLSFTNRRLAVRAIEMAIKRSLNDIERPAPQSAAMRSALKSLLLKLS